MMVFFADKITFSMWKPICRILYGSVSIMVIFSCFYKYQKSFSHETIFGKAIQLVGRRTLDIYMIHYFVLPYHLELFGQWFTSNPNPVLEFFITSIISLMVLSVSVLIGNIIRTSRFLSHYLLGTS